MSGDQRIPPIPERTRKLWRFVAFWQGLMIVLPFVLFLITLLVLALIWLSIA